MTDDERSNLQSSFGGVALRRFDFSKHEPHVNIRVNTGSYAWKPIIIGLEVAATSTIVVWLDAGDVVTGRLDWIRRLVQENGFFSPFSAGTVKEWTHPEMLARFAVDRETMSRPNLNGAVISFDGSSWRARELLRSWVACANDVNCIAPEGSDRGNHRQDQSALTVLAYVFKMAPRGYRAQNLSFIGVLTHQDVE